MTSIVIELQREALESQVKTSDLLRKALVVSRKLKLSEMQSWINAELNGYSSGVKIPEYRVIQGQIKTYNPYRGYIPVIFEDSEMGKKLSKRENAQPVSELENIVVNSKGTLQMPFPPNIQKMLMEMGGNPSETTLMISSSSIIGILDAVRTLILNWALKLEEDGIMGENFSFSPKEQNMAAHSQNITNFYAPVSQSQVQQGNSESVLIAAGRDINLQDVKEFVRDLKQSLNNLTADKDQMQEVDAEIKTINAQLESPKPKKSIIQEGLKSIGRILESVTGNVATALLLRCSNLQ